MPLTTPELESQDLRVEYQVSYSVVENCGIFDNISLPVLYLHCRTQLLQEISRLSTTLCVASPKTAGNLQLTPNKIAIRPMFFYETNNSKPRHG